MVLLGGKKVPLQFKLHKNTFLSTSPNQYKKNEGLILGKDFKPKIPDPNKLKPPLAFSPLQDYSIKRLEIFSNALIKIMTETLGQTLNNMGIETKINYREINNNDIEKCAKDQNLYILLFNAQYLYNSKTLKYKQNLNKLPKNKYIIFQIEQLNQNTNFYQSIDFMYELINDSYFVFDYSQTNLNYYPQYLKNKVTLITPIINELEFTSNQKTIDILFVGYPNERRLKILQALRKATTFNIEIVKNKYGNDLIEIINKSKILLNLHAFPNAILEVFRIHDLISFDIKIVSELPGDGDQIKQIDQYKEYVDFTEIISPDLKNMNTLINKLMESDNKIDLLKKKLFIENINLKNKRIIENKFFNVINILIRTTYRPESFLKCINSILNQKYTQYRIVICYDDERCKKYLDFYEKYKNIKIIKSPDVDKSKECFYNLYCNHLLHYAQDGWIMFLDDDDMFESDKSLDIINSYISNQNNNNLIFWKFKRPDKLIYPNINDIQINTIASCGYCFHSKFRYSSIWINGQGGDFNYINGLVLKNNFQIYFIDKILTKTTFDNYKKGNYGSKEI